MGHMARDCPLLPRVLPQQTQSQPRVQQQQQAPMQQHQQTGGSGGSRGRGHLTHLTRADAEAAHLVEDVGATPSRRLACGYPPLVSQDAECDSVLWVFVDFRSRRV
ncbi:hypothetical protein Taro_036705 [Colocasia esculenta]|uniref:Uncharacterized protein n=1 Tax=Colocasia esculenta TaxID=4460 RepID=A0A843WAL0_COLES|nr:hypothetical protein [Colocasia esculenta]